MCRTRGHRWVRRRIGRPISQTGISATLSAFAEIDVDFGDANILDNDSGPASGHLPTTDGVAYRPYRDRLRDECKRPVRLSSGPPTVGWSDNPVGRSFPANPSDQRAGEVGDPISQ